MCLDASQGPDEFKARKAVLPLQSLEHDANARANGLTLTSKQGRNGDYRGARQPSPASLALTSPEDEDLPLVVERCVFGLGRLRSGQVAAIVATRNNHRSVV